MGAGLGQVWVLLWTDLLIDLRRELRSQKNYALADHIRQQLTELGVALEDSKEGTTWRWASRD